MNLEIRMATGDDAEIIRRFIHELAGYQNQAGSVKVDGKMLKLQLEADKPPFECLIAEADGRELGFALFYCSYSTWEGKPGIYLEDLYVDPDARLMGVGRKLLIELCKLARKRGATRLDWSVNANNPKAANFYSLIGAEPMREWIKWRLDEAGMESLINCESLENGFQSDSPKMSLFLVKQGLVLSLLVVFLLVLYNIRCAI